MRRPSATGSFRLRAVFRQSDVQIPSLNTSIIIVHRLYVVKIPTFAIAQRAVLLHRIEAPLSWTSGLNLEALITITDENMLEWSNADKMRCSINSKKVSQQFLTKIVNSHLGSLEVIPSSKEVKVQVFSILESKLDEKKKTQV
ncbi:hypothetical protein Tco_0438736 [Tanacetum coccineum]